jgi:hypothetical protein
LFSCELGSQHGRNPPPYEVSRRFVRRAPVGPRWPGPILRLLLCRDSVAVLPRRRGYWRLVWGGSAGAAVAGQPDGSVGAWGWRYFGGVLCSWGGRPVGEAGRLADEMLVAILRSRNGSGAARVSISRRYAELFGVVDVRERVFVCSGPVRNRTAPNGGPGMSRPVTVPGSGSSMRPVIPSFGFLHVVDPALADGLRHSVIGVMMVGTRSFSAFPTSARCSVGPPWSGVWA